MVKISVIIPVYNSEKYLERCLNSVLSQTFQEFEAICINDGSTDTSLKILENYQNKDSRIKIINIENSGVSIARNIGLKKAVGKYISFVDSDDYIDNNFLEKLYIEIDKNKAQVASASIIRESDKKQSKLIEYVKNEITENSKDNLIKNQCRKYCFIWNKLYLASFLKENNLYFKDDFIYEDVFFTSSLLEIARKIVYVSNTYYHYWKNPDSLIKKSTDKTRYNKLEAEKHLSKICRRYGIFKENEMDYKKEFYFFGIKVLRINHYLATKKYLFLGFIPVLVVKKSV